MAEEKKNVVVIGSGIGGSGIAALLSHRGFNVTVLEKLNLFGGRCCSRERDGFVIDLGVHTFSQAGAGALGEILRKCGKNDKDLIQWGYTNNPRQKLSYFGKIVEFPHQITQLGGDLDTYMGIIQKIVQMPTDEISTLYAVSLKEWLDNYTHDKLIHSIFAYIAELYFVVPYYKSSAGEFIRSMQEQARKRQSGYPVGGCKVIPEHYLKVLEENGGQARSKCGVRKIIVKDGKAVGVETTDNEIIEADIIISNADPGITTRLVGEENLPEDYVSRVKKLEYGPGAFLIKFALNKKITDEKFIMHIAHQNAMEYYQRIHNGEIPDKVNLMIPVISNFDPSIAPEGCQLIIAGSLSAIKSDWDKWHQSVLSSTKDVFPDIEDHILFTETTSPGDVDRLMGEGGAVIGLAQILDQVGEKRISQKTPIDNLYVVGAEAGGWGIGTELAANSALELNEIILNSDCPVLAMK